MNVKARQAIERRIVSRIVRDAIAAGYLVSVHDGMETTVRRSQEHKRIMVATATVDEETLFIYEVTGKCIGRVFLVYGNSGWDVVCDYSVSLEHILVGATALAEKIETQCA